MSRQLSNGFGLSSRTRCALGFLIIGLAWYASRPAPEDAPRPRGDRTTSRRAPLLAIGGPPLSGSSAHSDAKSASKSPQKYEPEPPPVPQVVGRWRDQDHDNRFLTLNADGTGLMVATLEGLAAKLFAARLELDIEWSLDGKQLTLITLGGRPEGKAKLVMKLYGTHNVEQILELTENRLLVQHDEDQQFDWRRLADDDPAGLKDQETE